MTLVLVDTNVLLRGADAAHQMHQIALDSQTKLGFAGRRLCVVSQNLVEFRAVATRPLQQNGLGLSQQAADSELLRLKSIYPVFFDEPSIFIEWEKLVVQYPAFGKQNHDARLVAAMLVHKIDTILTFNDTDFVRYPMITVLKPQNVI